MTLRNIREKVETFEYCGTEYKLLYSNEAWIELEEIYGTPVDRVFTLLDAKSMKAFNDLLWAGLLEFHGLSQKEVARMFSMEHVPELQIHMQKALGYSLPEPEKVTGKKNNSKNSQTPIP